MRFYIPLFAAALAAGALVGCDQGDSGTTTTKTEETTTTTNATPDTSPPNVHGEVTINGEKVKENVNAAADATKRGLEKAGTAIENGAERTKDALTPDRKVEVKTETTTTTTQP